jgi:hypothetical protein
MSDFTRGIGRAPFVQLRRTSAVGFGGSGTYGGEGAKEINSPPATPAGAIVLAQGAVALGRGFVVIIRSPA